MQKQGVFMGHFLDSDSGIMRFLGTISDICFISLMWLFGCLPVITIGASSTAAYYTMVKVVRKDTGYLRKEFWKSFKLNFKDATIITVIYELVAALLMFNIYTMYLSLGLEFSDIRFYMLFAYVVLFLVLLGIMIYTWPILSRFALGRFAVVRFAIQLQFRHMPSTLLMLVTLLAGFVIMVFFPIGVLFMPGLCLYEYSFVMERILRRYMSRDMLAQWDHEDAVDQMEAELSAEDK